MDVSLLFRENVKLRNGRRVALRPIRRTDASRLIELHGRLSKETQYLRFFGAKPHLSAEEAAYLAGVDFDRRFAIVAVVREDRADRIVAVGRFDLGDDDLAEAAIVVRDDYQRVGLGTAILERMVQVARGRGVKEFAGEILAENDKMLGLLSNNGMELGPVHEATVTIAVPIDQTPPVVRAMKLVAPFSAELVERVFALAAGAWGRSEAKPSDPPSTTGRS